MQPPRPTSAYLFYQTQTVKDLKENEGLSHKEAFSKAS
jgi:hypothetical protein